MITALTAVPINPQYAAKISSSSLMSTEALLQQLMNKDPTDLFILLARILSLKAGTALTVVENQQLNAIINTLNAYIKTHP